MANIKTKSKDEFIEENKQAFIQKAGKGELPKVVEKQQTVKDILIEDLSTEDAIYQFTRGLIPETFAKDYKRLKKLQDKINKVESDIKTKLIQMFETHPEMAGKSVSIDGLKFTYVSSYDKNTVDTKKLQEEYPDIYKKLLKASTVKSSIKTYVEF